MTAFICWSDIQIALAQLRMDIVQGLESDALIRKLAFLCHHLPGSGRAGFAS
jgi:hypothetical protein